MGKSGVFWACEKAEWGMPTELFPTGRRHGNILICANIGKNKNTLSVIRLHRKAIRVRGVIEPFSRGPFLPNKQVPKFSLHFRWAIFSSIPSLNSLPQFPPNFKTSLVGFTCVNTNFFRVNYEERNSQISMLKFHVKKVGESNTADLLVARPARS